MGSALISVVTVIAIGLAAVLPLRAQEVPPALAALATKAVLDGTVVAWCRAEFVLGRPGAFAVAVSSPAGGGRYLAIDPKGRAAELGRFTGGPDLSCYSAGEAEKLDAALSGSGTIEGHVTPRWSTTVVCGFTESTAAICWQYSTDNRAFVVVGGWIT